MGKIKYLFKKIRDTKGTFHAKMSSTKDKNGLDLTEAEDIKKRCQEHTHTHTQYTYDPYVTCSEKCSSKYLRFNGKNPNIRINSDVAIRKKP